MRCEDTREELVALLDDELPSEERAQVERHVAQCDSCRTELEGFETSRARIDSLLSREPEASRRFEELWAAATSAGDGRAVLGLAPRGSSRASASAGSRAPARGPGRVLGRIGLTVAAAAALALFIRDPGSRRSSPPPATSVREPVVLAEAVAPSGDFPEELLAHPDMFVDFVIVRRLEKLRQLPELVDALGADVGHT